MPATALLTIADLERMPDDGVHRELLEGELIELPPPKAGHSRAANRIYRSLQSYVAARKAGELYMEAGFKLLTDPQTWLQPDLSYVRADTDRQTPDDTYFAGAPDLAIEIISPSESAADIEAKVHAYRNAGATAIWLVFPRTRTIRVIRRDGLETTLTERDTLADAELFPGWQLPVRDVFSQ